MTIYNGYSGFLETFSGRSAICHRGGRTDMRNERYVRRLNWHTNAWSDASVACDQRGQRTILGDESVSIAAIDADDVEEFSVHSAIQQIFGSQTDSAASLFKLKFNVPNAVIRPVDDLCTNQFI